MAHLSWSLLVNSVAVTAAATLLALAAALPVALCLQWFPAAARRGLVVASIVVLALPSFFVAGMWMRIVGFAGAWSLGEGEWTARYWPMVLTAVVLAGMLWPVAALLLAGAWDRVDRRWLDAYPALRGWGLLRHLYLPFGWGALRQAGAVIAVLALGNFAVPSLFQARVWPEVIWVDFSTRYDALSAFGKSWPMVLLALAVTAIALRQPVSWPSRGYDLERTRVARSLGRRWAWGGALAAVVLLVLTGVVPVGLALMPARTWRELGPAFEAAWPAWVRSIGYAGGAATLALAFGLCTARWRWPVLLAPCFVLPGVFEGMLLLRGFGAPWFDGLRSTGAFVVAALTLRYAFVGWFAARHAWRSADSTLQDAAVLAGAGTRWRWRHVVWPASGPALLAGWYVLYVLGLWDVETLVLIVPPGGDSLALLIFNLLHYGHNPQVAAHCVWLGVAALLPLAAIYMGRWVSSVRSRRAGSSTTSGPERVVNGFAAVTLAFAASFLLTGCSEPTPKTGLPLKSELFDSVQVIGSRGTGPGQFLKPRSLAVDGEDRIYAVDMTGRVQRFGRDTRWEWMWQMPETDKGKAKGMATAPDGGLLVVEPHYHRVNHFTTEGVLVRQWGTHGTNQGQFWFPRSIAVGASGDCYVSEYGVVERVQRFTVDGSRFLGAFGSDGTGPGQLSRAEGIGTDRAGNVYVADSCNHRIQVFGPDGRWLRTHGRAGQKPGEFSYPYDVKVDARGYQYVCEFGNSRIQVLDAQDRPVEMLGGPGSAPDHMNNPWSLCLDSQGNLYVADSMNHRVLKFHRRTVQAGRTSEQPPREI